MNDVNPFDQTMPRSRAVMTRWQTLSRRRQRGLEIQTCAKRWCMDRVDDGYIVTRFWMSPRGILGVWHTLMPVVDTEFRAGRIKLYKQVHRAQVAKLRADHPGMFTAAH